MEYFENGSKSRETNVRNESSMLEKIGMDCFRAVPCEKMCGSKYHGPGAGAPGTLEKFFRMEQHENSPSLCFRAC